jgi:hypothetical protein
MRRNVPRDATGTSSAIGAWAPCAFSTEKSSSKSGAGPFSLSAWAFMPCAVAAWTLARSMGARPQSSAPGMPESRNTATFAVSARTFVSSCICAATFPRSSLVTPVTCPRCLGIAFTRPSATGSAMSEKTTGVVVVDCCAARAAELR